MPKLYDYNGRPVSTAALKREHAAPKITGARQPSYYSVVTGMTPERMANILMDSGDNDIEGYLTLAEEMEERDLHYRSVLSTRKHAVTGLEITAEAKTDKPRDIELADAVREQIIEHEEFSSMLIDAMDALGKGFSAIEIGWDTDGKRWFPRKYDWRDPRHFQFDEETLRELRIRDEADTANGIELPPYKFITHFPALKSGVPIRGGFARLVAVAYMCKGFAIKDWLAFLEVFGMPVRVGKYSEAASEEDRDMLAAAVANLASDAGAVIPDNMQLEFMESGGGKSSANDAIFRGMAEYLDGQVSKAVLGQTMTTDDGSSQSQANVHNDVRLDLLRHDAAQLSNTVNRCLTRPFIDLNFGAMPLAEYPRIKIAYNPPEDLELFTKSFLPWVNVGVTVEASVIRDRFGVPDPEKGADVIGGAGAKVEAKDGEGPTAKNTRAMNAKAKQDAIDEIISEISDDWIEITDEAYEPILKAVNEANSYSELKSMLKDVDIEQAELVEHIATQMFKARGLGDSTDE